ncbi:NAD(P)/FAD-dependent oxidoreductase [Georgenia sp. AZ-5]|uniref:NAD(P)/FAD-dependent oxidoreductase n=1 Tax=Georgenia sp. AZ-5 TaxID=3367526 RepID=UPI0037553A48
MMNDRAVIVGAGAAGLATAEALRDRGWTGEIVLVGAEPHLPYDRPPLSKQLLAGKEEFEFVQLTTHEACTSRDIDLRLGVEATRLDTRNKLVHLAGGEAIGYDSLVIATGVDARRLVPAEGIAGVVTLRTFADAMDLRAQMAHGKHVIIVGAGFIGLEVAATAISKGCVVDVVEPTPGVLFGKFPTELAQRIERTHLIKGVRFHFGQVVEEWNVRTGRIESVTLSDGETLRADAALVGIGTAPAVGWLDGAGLEVANGIVCDSQGQAAQDVYAVGDVANWFHPLLGVNQRIEHRLSAGDQAQVVAAVLTGTDVPHLDLPFFWTDQYDEKWQAYGYVHGDAELEVVLDDIDANRLVAVLKNNGYVEAVIGKNAAKQLIPYRRDLRAAAMQKLVRN